MHHAKKMCGGLEIKLHALIITVIYGVEWSASSPVILPKCKELPLCVEYRAE
jgi:hypothetical protein